VAETATAKLASLVPMAPVADVQRSIDFYAQLGFEVGRADPPVPRARQTMVIYFYAEDVAAYHRELRDKGLDAGPLEQRFYMESGEFELKDPDGYCLLVGHT
jgi:catechol 2,3-dioxygenase-like lactoylglutathione lyase family enzyme